MSKIAFVLLCILATCIVGARAFAQAGSTGGTLGKTDKSVSGGDEPPQQRPKAKQRTSTVGNVPAHSISGKWAWTAKCADGSENWAGSFELTQNTDGAVSGSFTGNGGPGSFSGTVVGNRLIGNNCYTITRHCTQMNFTIVGGGSSLTGSESSASHGTCKYQASRS
jgi:hypothetical protein